MHRQNIEKPLVQCTLSFTDQGYVYFLDWRVGEHWRYAKTCVGWNKPSKSEERRIKTELYAKMEEDVKELSK